MPRGYSISTAYKLSAVGPLHNHSLAVALEVVNHPLFHGIVQALVYDKHLRLVSCTNRAPQTVTLFSKHTSAVAFNVPGPEWTLKFEISNVIIIPPLEKQHQSITPKVETNP